MSTKVSLDAIRPSTRFSDEVNRMVAAMRTLRSNSVAYVAVPVTGGRRHVEWLTRNLIGPQLDRIELSRRHQAEVVQPNLSDANDFCDRVREARNAVCINPAQLYLKHWNQDDYRHFWSRVIESLGTMMFLASGWNLSIGCLFECLIALDMGIPIYGDDLNPLSPTEAASLALEGAKVLKNLGESSELLNTLIEQFENLSEV